MASVVGISSVRSRLLRFLLSLSKGTFKLMMADDPSNWSKAKTSKGKTVYYNRVTGTAQWEIPKRMYQESQGSNNGQGEPKRRRITPNTVYGVWNNKVF